MPALVIEGGANRATYATGAACALQAAGFVPDAVYGTSAGGALAAWYAAGQMDRAVETWRGVNDPALLSYRRVLRGGYVFDLKLLYHHYYPNVFGLDVEAIHRAPFPAIVTLTDAQTGATRYVDLRAVEHPTHAVHAGAAIPVLAESPVEWDGRLYVDGGTTAPIPLARAIEDGHKEIVAILNRPPGERRPESALAVRLVSRRFPALAEHVRLHHEYHNEAVRLALAPPTGVRVRVIRPSSDTGVGRATRDLRKLREAIERGRRDGQRAAAEMGLTGIVAARRARAVGRPPHS